MGNWQQLLPDDVVILERITDWLVHFSPSKGTLYFTPVSSNPISYPMPLDILDRFQQIATRWCEEMKEWVLGQLEESKGDFLQQMEVHRCRRGQGPKEYYESIKSVRFIMPGDPDYAEAEARLGKGGTKEHK